MNIFCKHDYDKWSAARDQSVSSGTSLKMQVTCCKKCGKIKLRYILWSSCINADNINGALGI